MIGTALDLAAVNLPQLMRSALWLGVAWMMLCRARKIGPDSRRLVNISIACAGAGALGEALTLIVPWTARQAMAIDLLTVGGWFGLLMAFSSEWAGGAPEVTRRR